MRFRRIILFSFLLLFFIAVFDCLSQNKSKNGKRKIELIKWTSLDCDNTYDPFRLIARITDSLTSGEMTYVTVNFSDNCCVKFEPKVKFKDNKLFLLPYEKYLGDACNCHCCFSIQYEISGLIGKNYEIYFGEKKIVLSENYYDTIKPSYDLHNGEIINRINKYGFAEGYWKEFHENGNEKSISKFPDNVKYFKSYPDWSKSYYLSGKNLHYFRNDTFETWFEDGELKFQHIEYKISDTTFEKGFKKFENRKFEKKFYTKFYPTVFKSEFDPEYRGEGAITEVIYDEEFYENGQLKYQYTKDTTFTWYETGQIKLKRYVSGEIEYNEEGHIIKKAFEWKGKGPKSYGDIEFALFVYYNQNDKIEHIEYSRDEIVDHGEAVSPGVSYEWKWNNEMKLIESPPKWKEELPWQKIDEISNIVNIH